MVSSESPLEQKSQCPQFTFLTDSANLPWKRMSASLKFFPRQKEYLKATGCTPLQYSCLESPMDGGAWWAAIYGVAQSRARLKRLSSSSSSEAKVTQSSLTVCDTVHGTLQARIQGSVAIPFSRGSFQLRD